MDGAILGTDITGTKAILDLLMTGGLTSALTFALVGAVRRWWYPGTVVDMIRADFQARLDDKEEQIEGLRNERDEWKGVAIALTGAVERAVGAARGRSDANAGR